ncbi:MAG: xanthine dehydrogenase family protein subunit M [Acidimicrobiia bacterium]|nr:xanthine dehydrogenase family protein subunit M [Acidimicrobiia bacterium]
MYPRAFDYVAVASIDEAIEALASHPGAKVMSGGMSLIPMMKLRLLSPETVIDIGKVPGLDQIEDGGDHISIGALVTHGAIVASSLLRAEATALVQAASWTGDVQVRNRGTLCGALAHADLAADSPAAVLALGATMIAQGPGGTREIAAADFFVDTLQSALTPDEVLVGLRIPKRGGGSAYDKLGRRGGHSDYAVAGVAAWVSMSGGVVSDCGVALTGVGTKPAMATAVMEALRGSGPDGVEAAASHATDGVTVLEDLYGSEAYKAHLARVYTARAVQQAMAAAS